MEGGRVGVPTVYHACSQSLSLSARLCLANKLTDNGSRQCTYLPLDICCPLCSRGAEEPGQHNNDDDDDDHNVIDDDVDGDCLPQAEEHC